MRTWCWLIVLLSLGAPAWAADILCDYPARSALGEPRVVYLRSLDPSQNPDLGNCVVLAKADTAAQRAFLEPYVAAGTQRYLKRVGGLLAEMDQSEKDAVDAVIAARLAARQALRDEATQQDLCSTATLTQINTLLAQRRATLQTAINTAKANNQADIDAIAAANLTTLKASLTQMNNVLFAVAGNILDETFALDQKLARCLVVLRQGVR